jgi:hypothetical protein
VKNGKPFVFDKNKTPVDTLFTNEDFFIKKTNESGTNGVDYAEDS